MRSGVLDLVGAEDSGCSERHVTDDFAGRVYFRGSFVCRGSRGATIAASRETHRGWRNSGNQQQLVGREIDGCSFVGSFLSQRFRVASGGGTRESL